MLEGMSEAFRGLKNQPLPDGWEQLTAKIAKSDDARSMELVRTLSLIFGDPTALKQLRTTLADTNAKTDDRIAAIELLSERKIEGLVPQLVKLLDEPALRARRAAGLSAYDDDSIPAEILKRYSKWEETDRIEAINTLASRSFVCQGTSRPRWKRSRFRSKTSPRSMPASLRRSRTARSTSA